MCERFAGITGGWSWRHRVGKLLVWDETECVDIFIFSLYTDSSSGTRPYDDARSVG